LHHPVIASEAKQSQTILHCTHAFATHPSSALLVGIASAVLQPRNDGVGTLGTKGREGLLGLAFFAWQQEEKLWPFLT